MNVKATAKYIHQSPRKVRLVVDLVRGLKIEEARKQLQFSPKNAARPVLKVLNSAIANAENNFSLDTKDFVVTTAFVDEGPTIHRFRPRAQGRATPIRKRMSHITIEVGPKDGEAIVKEEENVEALKEESDKKVEPKAKKKSAEKKTKVPVKKESKQANAKK